MKRVRVSVCFVGRQYTANVTNSSYGARANCSHRFPLRIVQTRAKVGYKMQEVIDAPIISRRERERVSVCVCVKCYVDVVDQGHRGGCMEGGFLKFVTEQLSMVKIESSLGCLFKLRVK